MEENKKILTKKNLALSIMILFNLISLIFVITYSIITDGSITASVFTLIMLITFISDLFYFGKSKYQYGYILILSCITLFVINTVSLFLVGLSIFKTSMNIIGNISMALIPIISILYFTLIVCNKIPVRKQTESVKIQKLKPFFVLTMLSGILILFIIGAVTLSKTTAMNTNVINITVQMILLGVSFFSVILRLLADSKAAKNRKKVVTAIACLMLLVTAVQLSVIKITDITDNNRNNTEFQSVFGNVDEGKLYKPRNTGYSFAEEFFGVPTVDYNCQKDIEYYKGTEGLEKDITLRYDVYYPTFANAHKAVMINLHGSGGDKNIGNYAHRNKYFASRGYVVYDLQFGDFNEKNINFNWEIRNAENMLFHIREFFIYAKEHNDIGADLGNTFLTGVSMGGSLVSKFALSYEHNLSDYGISIKGYIPVYPGYSVDDDGINNYLNYVTEDSAPCLLVMSMSDVVVYRDVVDYTEEAYKRANNNNYACIKITYAGHGSDGLMTGSFNQAYMYYTERFMSLFRS